MSVWSADVCSSDLSCGQAPSGRRARLQLADQVRNIVARLIGDQDVACADLQSSGSIRYPYMPRLERLAADFSTVCKRDDPDRQGRACLQHTAYAVAPAFDDESPPFGPDGTAATQVTAKIGRA